MSQTRLVSVGQVGRRWIADVVLGWSGAARHPESVSTAQTATIIGMRLLALMRSGQAAHSVDERE